MAYYLHAKFHWNRICDLEKKGGKGFIFVRNPRSYKGLKTPGQIVNFTYSEMSIICFSTEQLPSLTVSYTQILTTAL